VAITFASASSEGYSVLSALATAPAFTFACWFKPVATGVNGRLFSLANDSDVLKFHGLHVESTNRIVCHTRDTNFGQAKTGANVVAGVWQHAAGRWTSSASRKAYLGGTDTATNTDSRSPTGIDSTSFAFEISGTPSNFYNGDMAECGFWDLALSDVEIEALADGVCPLLIRPESLIGYWPLINTVIAASDLTSNGNSLTTVEGTPVKASSDPPLLRRQSAQILQFSPVTAADVLQAQVWM